MNIGEMKKRVIGKYLSGLATFALSASLFAQEKTVVINEFVVDPKKDRTGDGFITASDEFIELYNLYDEPIDLYNWRLELIDTTPESKALSGTIQPQSYFVLINPIGSQNNSGEIRLLDDMGKVVDSVIYGTWQEAVVMGGNSSGLFDESLSRYPDGGTNWVKTYATMENANQPLSGLALLIKKMEGNMDGVHVSSSSVLDKKLIVQKSLDMKSWSQIYTNEANMTLNYVDTNALNSATMFYRAFWK
mgnify:CR=1 FL=1